MSGIQMPLKSCVLQKKKFDKIEMTNKTQDLKIFEKITVCRVFIQIRTGSWS